MRYAHRRNKLAKATRTVHIGSVTVRLPEVHYSFVSTHFYCGDFPYCGNFRIVRIFPVVGISHFVVLEPKGQLCTCASINQSITFPRHDFFSLQVSFLPNLVFSWFMTKDYQFLLSHRCLGSTWLSCIAGLF